MLLKVVEHWSTVSSVLKVNFALEQAMKAQREGGGVGELFL
jgi:hypothetical protein